MVHTEALDKYIVLLLPVGLKRVSVSRQGRWLDERSIEDQPSRRDDEVWRWEGEARLHEDHHRDDDEWSWCCWNVLMMMMMMMEGDDKVVDQAIG